MKKVEPDKRISSLAVLCAFRLNQMNLPSMEGVRVLAIAAVFNTACGSALDLPMGFDSHALRLLTSIDRANPK